VSRARSVEIVAGAACAAVVLGALPLALRRPDDPELHLIAKGSHEIAELRAAAIEPEPEALRARLETRRIGEAPGVILRSDRVVYGARWEREVTSVAYVGPFDREGDAWPCGVSLHAGAALFDPKGAGKGILDALDAEVRARFPRTIEGIVFPAVKETTLELAPIAGALRAKVSVELKDGTRFVVPLQLAVESKEGVLHLRRLDRTPPSWTGATRGAAARKGYLHWILGPINDWTMGVADEVAGRVFRQQVGTIVAQSIGTLDLAIAGFQRGFAPFPARPGDRVELRLAGPPLVTAAGVGLTLCPTVRLASPKVDPRVPGPPRLASGDPVPIAALALREDAAKAQLTATMSPAALQELLYVLFQTGALRDAGKSEAVLRELPDRVADLAFPVRGFEPRLPPIVRPLADRGGFELLLGDVAIGDWDGRTVVGHARFDLALDADGRTLRATATPRTVALDCVRAPAGAGVNDVRIEPCLSDLLPALRGELEGAPRTWTVRTAVLDTALPVGPLRLALRGLSASSQGGALTLGATGTFSHEPADAPR
jgi:hypothetical protein